jgi:hypothetical protein
VTTIAFKGGVLAADTATSSKHNIIRQDVPKIAAHHGCLAGASGSAVYCAAFLRWFLASEFGEPPKASTEDGDNALIVRPDGTLHLYEEGGWFPSDPPYYAAGSGCDYALGAMFAGADAETAVLAGIEHDPHSGGSVTVLRLETMP